VKQYFNCPNILIKLFTSAYFYTLVRDRTILVSTRLLDTVVKQIQKHRTE